MVITDTVDHRIITSFVFLRIDMLQCLILRIIFIVSNVTISHINVLIN